MPEHTSSEENFEAQKQIFFTRLGMRAREWLKTHKELGKLWDGPKKDRWENVSEHCLVEAARAETFGELLGLAPDVQKELFAAAILHDYDKKYEIESTRAKGATVESFFEAYDHATQALLDAGIDPSIVALSDSVAISSLPDMEKVLGQTELSDYDIARLVLHYIDDYTRGSNWVTPAESEQNDFDRRMDANVANTHYQHITDAGLHDEQRRVGKLVERKLAELVRNRAGKDVGTLALPEFIDTLIKEKINRV